MRSNNSFKTHNISHLSPSSINTYITDPPQWIMRYLFGIRSAGGAGATYVIESGTDIAKQNVDDSKIEKTTKAAEITKKQSQKRYMRYCIITGFVLFTLFLMLYYLKELQLRLMLLIS